MAVVVKRPKADKGRTSTTTSKQATTLPDGAFEQISRKAYELWEQRGRTEGHALRDWLEAEEIVLQRTHEGRT